MLLSCLDDLPQAQLEQLRQLHIVKKITLGNMYCLLVRSDTPLLLPLRAECATLGVTLVTPNDWEHLCAIPRKSQKDLLFAGSTSWVHHYAPIFLHFTIRWDEENEFWWRIDEQEIARCGITITH